MVFPVASFLEIAQKTTSDTYTLRAALTLAATAKVTVLGVGLTASRLALLARPLVLTTTALVKPLLNSYLIFFLFQWIIISFSIASF